MNALTNSRKYERLLHEIRRKNEKAVHEILQGGMKLPLPSRESFLDLIKDSSPLSEAVIKGNLNIVEAILNTYCKQLPRDEYALYFLKPLFIATIGEKKDILQAILNTGVRIPISFFSSLIAFPIQAGNTDIVSLLMEAPKFPDKESREWGPKIKDILIWTIDHDQADSARILVEALRKMADRSPENKIYILEALTVAMQRSDHSCLQVLLQTSSDIIVKFIANNMALSYDKDKSNPGMVLNNQQFRDWLRSGKVKRDKIFTGERILNQLTAIFRTAAEVGDQALMNALMAVGVKNPAALPALSAIVPQAITGDPAPGGRQGASLLTSHSEADQQPTLAPTTMLPPDRVQGNMMLGMIAPQIVKSLAKIGSAWFGKSAPIESKSALIDSDSSSKQRIQQLSNQLKNLKAQCKKLPKKLQKDFNFIFSEYHETLEKLSASKIDMNQLENLEENIAACQEDMRQQFEKLLLSHPWAKAPPGSINFFANSVVEAIDSDDSPLQDDRSQPKKSL